MTYRLSLKCWFYLVALLAFSAGAVLHPGAQEPTTESVFADAPFDAWQAQGPQAQVPWQIHMVADKLSFHQRLIANIQVEVPGPELLKRRGDGQILLLVQVRNGLGVSSRDFETLELSELKPEAKRSDVEFSWQAFAVPGQYEVSVALWDKKSGEHNFMQRLFNVSAYKNDPLPGMWRGLEPFEFWSTNREGPGFIFHSDIEGRLYLPLQTRRPVHMEVLLDMTPSADIFRGSYGYYNRYLSAALPMFKVFNQINVTNGSKSAAALDLLQRQVRFEQDDGKDLDWPSLSKALAPDNGPGVVSVKDLKNRQQSPVYLREEILRRIKADTEQKTKQREKPLHVIVLIGNPMDTYTFPSLPAIETGNEEDCLIYYLQFDFSEHEEIRFGGGRFRGDRLDRRDKGDRGFQHFERQGYLGAAGNVEKMLKPLKMRTFQIRSADDVRHALAKVLEEVGKL
ncbi:MAG TPA: hypothetical protein VGK24_02110 [Candidatus Angelobacter sp.]|jgi:hypothetical protein